MSNLPFLMRREWLQHRFAWSLIVVLPTALALLLVSFGSLQFDGEERQPQFAVLAAMAAMGGAIALYGVIMWVSSLILVSGVARRDHADRSVEFWLSLPTGHSESLVAPLIVHLLLAPMAALAVGLLSGLTVSMVLVSRVADFGAWLALPWATLMGNGLALVARGALGIVLATIWLSPVILAGVLLTAWFRRWGLVILGVGIGLGSWIIAKVFGHPFLIDVLAQMFENAGRSIVFGDPNGMVIETGDDMTKAVGYLPSWAWSDAGSSLGLLASPLLPGVLIVSAACFYALVMWRQRGAGAAG